MKLLITTNDPVHGSALADGLRSTGHRVTRAWSSGEAVILLRHEPPSLAIIDRCHGENPETSRLAARLLDQGIDILWLGDPPDLSATPPGVLVAVLRPPCDSDRVAEAVNDLVRRRIDPSASPSTAGLTYL
jgi:CheY-like chemotaxis protein